MNLDWSGKFFYVNTIYSLNITWCNTVSSIFNERVVSEVNEFGLVGEVLLCIYDILTQFYLVQYSQIDFQRKSGKCSNFASTWPATAPERYSQLMKQAGDGLLLH